jgi:hypothetical protein
MFRTIACDALGCKLAHWHKIPVIEEEGGVCPGDTEDNSHKRASVVSSSSFATALLVEDDLEDEVENDVVDDVNGEVVSDAEDADEDDSVGTASDVDPSEQTLEAAVGILRTLVVPYNFYITPAGGAFFIHISTCTIGTVVYIVPCINHQRHS